MKTIRLFAAALMFAPVANTSAQNLANGLQACYPLDCDNAVNLAPTGNALNGTLFNVTCTADKNGNSNSAYAFANNVNSYIKLPNDSRLKPNAISFSAWVKFNNITTRQYIVFAKNTCYNYFEGYDLHGEPVGGQYKLQLVKADNGCAPATEQDLVGTISLNAGTWYHVGFYMGNDSLKLYVNGQLDDAAGTTLNFSYDNTGVILGGTNESNFNRPLDGAMDNVRFYDRKLTDNEFYLLYSATCSAPSTNVGIHAVSASSRSTVELYPNPGTGKFYLRNGKGTQVYLYDVSGKIIEHTTRTVDETTSEIMLVHPVAGMYLCRMVDADGAVIQTSRLVVTR